MLLRSKFLHSCRNFFQVASHIHFCKSHAFYTFSFLLLWFCYQHAQNVCMLGFSRKTKRPKTGMKKWSKHVLIWGFLLRRLLATSGKHLPLILKVLALITQMPFSEELNTMWREEHRIRLLALQFVYSVCWMCIELFYSRIILNGEENFFFSFLQQFRRLLKILCSWWITKEFTYRLLQSDSAETKKKAVFWGFKMS